MPGSESSSSWPRDLPSPSSEGVGTEPPAEVSAGAAFAHGWDRLKRFFWPLVGLTVLLWLLELPGQAISLVGGMEPFSVALVLGALGPVYLVFVGIPLGYGMSFVAYRASIGRTPRLTDLFEGFRHYGAALASGLLVFLIVAGGLILLVIPGIIFALRLMFVPYLVTVEDRDGGDAVRESWRRTRGHLLTLFLFALMALGVAILGVLLLLVGIVPARALIEVGVAGLYRTMSERYAGQGVGELGGDAFEGTPRPVEGVGEG